MIFLKLWGCDGPQFTGSSQESAYAVGVDLISGLFFTFTVCVE
jgi:hypothetical protein